ncbi:LuxR C-terminal-related transcriptional regulator [Streptomyces mirabilis]|uniref:LuxR C-terminal-related transcriptional regulator n=1 Tax=Streptomyces mirabilis TaxID=68239 RepID=UPI0038280E02
MGNLVADITTFVDRRRELAEINRLLSSSREVTLTGVGGVGKSRLALRAAIRQQRKFPDGAWLVPLAELDNSASLVQAVATTLGVRNLASGDPMKLLSDYLAHRRLLLILDNCEHLLDACADLVDTLQRTAPDLRILVTSRQSLGVEAENILTLLPLSIPDSETYRYGTAKGFSAVKLFEDRASAVWPTFTVTNENAASVGRLCKHLDGIPLAIELAAVQMRALSVEQILTHLDDRFRPTAIKRRASAPRQQTLRATIDWSFDLCSPEEQTLWARLSVFSGSFAQEAVQEVCSGGCLYRANISELLFSLVDKSILSHEQYGSLVRYRLLETIRQYGRARLQKSGEETILRRRHRDWYRRLSSDAEAEWFGPKQLEWSRRLRMEYANLRTAMEFCVSEPSEINVGLEIATYLRVYWLYCGLVNEGRGWIDRLLQLDATPGSVRAKGMWIYAWLAVLQDDLGAANPILDEVRAVAQRNRDDSAVAYGTHIAGMSALYDGDLDTATAMIREALARHRTANDLVGVAHALIRLATIAILQGDVDAAIDLSHECIDLSEPHEEHWFRAHALWILGVALWRRGDDEQASKIEQDSVRIRSTFKDDLGLAMSLETMAWIASAAYPERAATLLGALHRIWREGRFAPIKYMIDFHEKCENGVRQTLGEEAFVRDFRKGASFTLDDTVAYVLNEKMPAVSVTAQGVMPPLLTRRENEVAGLVAQGMSNKEIANALFIAQRTAESHIDHILSKLGLNRRTELAAWFAGLSE